MAQRPTIKEVSKLAGVSFKTVSRVLNNEKNVSEETRRRVERVVDELNFRPSLAARTLAGRKSFQVGLLYDNPSPHYVYHLLAGAQGACADLGYRLITQPVDGTAPDFVRGVTALIDETHLDGIILSPPLSDMAELLDALDRRNVRYVRIEPGTRRDQGCSVTIDNTAAAAELTDHLIALGHRRIAFITGPDAHISSADRLRGYREALARHGIAEDGDLVVPGGYDLQSGREAARGLLTRSPPPSAIFAGNDEMAAGVLAAAHELAIQLPGALSVAGFDDADLAAAVWPPLTTIHQPVHLLGRAAAELLLAPDRMTDRITLDHRLVVRASTGPALAM